MKLKASRPLNNEMMFDCGGDDDDDEHCKFHILKIWQLMSDCHTG